MAVRPLTATTLRFPVFARLLPAVVTLLTGCADCRFLRLSCPAPSDPVAAAYAPQPDAAYRVGYPDALAVSFDDFSDWNAVVTVDLDGRLPLQRPGCPRVEGMTLDEVRRELASLAGTRPDRVTVRLVSPRASRVYVHGPIRGRSRVVPYQGPEPVIDMLKRIGGLPPGTKLSQVYVVRPNVANGKPPEVFRVDVADVLLGKDQTTNVVLLPSDAVYVGETTRSVFSRVLPDWLGPIYRRCLGLLPDEWWQRSLPPMP